MFTIQRIYSTHSVIITIVEQEGAGSKKKERHLYVCCRYVTRGEGIVHRPRVWGWESEFHTKGSC